MLDSLCEVVGWGPLVELRVRCSSLVLLIWIVKTKLEVRLFDK